MSIAQKYFDSHTVNRRLLDHALHSVRSLKDHYVQWSDSIFTLGCPQYLAESYPEIAEEKTSQQNDLLKSNFEELLNEVRGILEHALSEAVEYISPDLHSAISYPGFHLFPNHLPRGGKPHFDLQFQNLARQFFITPSSRFISFTLPLQLPPQGGGIQFWDITYNQYLQNPSIEFDDHSNECLLYEVGQLYVFKRLLLHKILPRSGADAALERITLQGHGLFDEIRKTWVLYW